MQTESFTVPEYLSLIGWPDPSEKLSCDLETLVRLHQNHSTSIPFENFDLQVPHLKLSTDPLVVWAKVKDGKRGTYCFEGNSLFLAALRLIGYEAVLIPVHTSRPLAGGFAEIPNHCSVLVSIDGQWIMVDVATIDCLDGVLNLSETLNSIQTMKNGVSYRFAVPSDPVKKYSFSDELTKEMDQVDPSFLSLNCLTVTLLKEDIKRDESFNPIIPLQKTWENRFSFRLPLKDQSNIPENLEKISKLQDIVYLPKSLHPEIALILTEVTTRRDPKSHHFKQWVGMRYSKDRQWKYIIAGFRYIVTKRPYGERIVKEYKQGFIDDKVNHEILQKNFVEILKHLTNDIGIKLDSEFLQNLNIEHNFIQRNINHIWAF
eukprot:TRINITY_DN1211_c0_g1_i1.p1 TRINITY_DN1211_c0_g1~~TRINITY_DN1211_c0_g1_i1.p1  ORF type:complete len:374 (-),score=51.08 TRINITY_DN1211_c0_g1_i1:45-1166(-)